MLGFKMLPKCMQTEQNMGIDEVEKDVQILSGHTVAVIIEKRVLPSRSANLQKVKKYNCCSTDSSTKGK